jgi:hypothetical protein
MVGSTVHLGIRDIRTLRSCAVADHQAIADAV